jgi:hypothetical protein
LRDIFSLQETINLAVIDRFFVDPERALLIFDLVAFCPFSCKFHHCVALDILDIEILFWESALELLLTENFRPELRIEGKGKTIPGCEPKIPVENMDNIFKRSVFCNVKPFDVDSLCLPFLGRVSATLTFGC